LHDALHAIADHCVYRSRDNIVCNQFMSCLPQVAQHVLTHNAKPDESNLRHFLLLVSVVPNCRNAFRLRQQPAKGCVR
jgi:hypothetical protein